MGLQGLIDVAAGVITFTMPAITGIGLLMLIAAWSLATQIVSAIKLRKEITG